MAELNMKQIVDRLNAEFTGEGRKLVFWYDDKAEFAEDVEAMELSNAKLYRLQPDNQFYTKYFLERVDTVSNYLIYAPFAKPDVRDNHLEDTLLYSGRFFADRASLVMSDLGIAEQYRAVIEKHVRFFAKKERTQRFYDLRLEHYDEEQILVGMLAVLCRARTCSFEEVARLLLVSSVQNEDALLREFARYDLEEAFWRLCRKYFGYMEAEPSLQRLLQALFVTYAERYVQAELPREWQSLVCAKSGNVIAFLDSLMNSAIYAQAFDALSRQAAESLEVRAVFGQMRVDDIVDCEIFVDADRVLVRWLVERLLAEDIGARANGLLLPELCEKRARMHFGRKMASAYGLLAAAYSLIKAARYEPEQNFAAVVERYLAEDYKLDGCYRSFYSCYARLSEQEPFEELRELVENIYTNEYLAKLLPAWNEALRRESVPLALPPERQFYERVLSRSKERTVVIISDALRYEVGQELFTRLKDDPKCTLKLSAQLAVLPSYTRLGMAALLPHRELTLTEDYRVLADGVLCDTLAGRQQLLQSYRAESVCVQFDEVKSMKVAQLRELLTKRQIVYVYHNQIDARGDKPNTEDEVFTACEEAIAEIMELIHRISTSGNTYHFIVTADHGFIYTRDKLREQAKLSGWRAEKKAFLNRRFIIADEAVEGDGIAHMRLGDVLANDDARIISFPTAGCVFKLAGGGANYVHGGSSPQEMILPLLDIKMERGHMETRKARIVLISKLVKITDLNVALDFLQREAVSDTVKAAHYRLYFSSASGERISGESICIADRREASSAERIFHLSFTFKDKRYAREQEYYLLACDEESGAEVWRHQVIMDIACDDDETQD